MSNNYCVSCTNRKFNDSSYDDFHNIFCDCLDDFCHICNRYNYQCNKCHMEIEILKKIYIIKLNKDEMDKNISFYDRKKCIDRIELLTRKIIQYYYSCKDDYEKQIIYKKIFPKINIDLNNI